MNYHSYQDQIDRTLRSIQNENAQLKKEVVKLKAALRANRKIVAFHDSLEKDFFSAASLKELIVNLNNQLLLRNDNYLVTVCLSRQYMEEMLGVHGYERLVASVRMPTKIGFLNIIDAADIRDHIGVHDRAKFGRTIRQTGAIFFPDHDEEVRSYAILPLIIRNQTIGSLNIGSYWSRHYYDRDMDRGMLDRLSAKLAIAIDNILSQKKLALQKELLDKDIESAALLQKSLLPGNAYESEHVDISSCFKPCFKLGGDFFDIVPMAEARLGVIVADVAGHGISAALVAAMLKSSLLTDNLPGLSAREIVDSTNRKFSQILSSEAYITLCFGAIDIRNRSMELVRAGHPYPILFRSSSGDRQELKPDGPPVGFDGRSKYTSMTVPLMPQDVIVFYTDGLLDALLDTEPTDARERMDFFSALGLSVPDGIDTALGNVHRRMEKMDLDDDASLVVVRIK